MVHFKLKIVLFFGFSTIPALVFSQSFSNPLNIPPMLTGTNFTLTFAASAHQFYPGVNTATYGVNGDYLGPTLVFNKDDSVNIDVVNNLTESTSCHWHGLHVPAYYDGGPHSPINAGDSWNARFKVMNKAATYWYHPHMHMTTQAQVTSGLAGMIIVRDTNESKLTLPRTYGLDDFPIILQDRKFSVSGQFLFYGLGDSILVNGTAYAYLNCPEQMVRLRILNGSNARIYNIGFSDQRVFNVIGGDGGLLSQPFSTNRLMLANGERAEIVVDFSGDLPGLQLYMMSFASEMATNIPGAITGPMGGNGPLDGTDFKLFKLIITSPTANPVTILPANLAVQNSWSPSSAAHTRNKIISGMGSVNGMGNFLLDNTTFDPMVFNDTVQLNDIEIWNVTNTSNMAHPMHIHDVQFYILNRNGLPPSPQESGLKDVFLVRPNETVSFITKFEDFFNDSIPYMYHCHNLAHEDMGMMSQFIVMNNVSGISENSNRDDINIYPNPSSSSWNINMEGMKKDVHLELFDMKGKKMKLKTAFFENTSNVVIENSFLTTGIYYLNIRTQSHSFARKLVKL